MNCKKKRAVSLIVLVITIIVLSILASTVIISLSSTNIISKANEAVKKTEAQQLEEAKALMLTDGMLGNTPEDMVIGDYTLTWDDEKKEVVQKLGEYVIKEGAIIPTNFYYVGGTKNTGLVISDNSADENKGVSYTCVGNQFVWIPVDDYSKFVRGTAEETSENSGVYKMTGALDDDYTEPYADGYATEQAEYEAMCASVKKYGGFYIARFEAGDGDVTAARTAATTAHTVVSKKNAHVYNYVAWGDSMSNIGTTGAVYLSQNMYKNHESVVSTLCYGVQWDSMLNYVSDETHCVGDVLQCSDHESWGNSDFEIADGYIPTTGSFEMYKAKNIYDLVGNVREWTMECGWSEGDTIFYRVVRGSAISGGDWTADGRGADFNHVNGYSHWGWETGFRVALYLK